MRAEQVHRNSLTATLLGVAAVVGAGAVARGVLLADLMAAVAVGAAIVRLLLSPKARLPFGPLTIGLSWFVLYCAAAAALYQMWFSPYLEPTSFIQSLMRLLLVLVSVAFLEFELSRMSPSDIGRMLRRLVMLASVGFVLQAAGFYIEAPITIIEDPYVDWDPFGPLPRLYGFFTEPSTSAVFCLMVLVLLFGLQEDRWWTTASLGLMLLASFALSALVLGVGIVLAATIRRTDRLKLMVRMAAVTAFAALLVLSVGTLREAVQVRVIDRVANVESDGSSSSRLVDSWTAATATAKPAAVGPGLGTFEAATLAEIRRGLKVNDYIVDSGGGWNMFANVLAVEGLLGMSVFAVGLVYGLRSKTSLIIVVSLAFVIGGIFQWFPWFYIVMLAHVNPLGNRPNNAAALRSRDRLVSDTVVEPSPTTLIQATIAQQAR